MSLLDLSHNKLGNGSGRALGKLLNGHSSLRHLDVSDNVIGAMGGNSIGHALQNSKLDELDIRMNRWVQCTCMCEYSNEHSCERSYKHS